MARPRVAVVGGGTAGLASAYFLGPHAEVTVFESQKRTGGHVNALQVPGHLVAVETGFLAFHRSHYPTLVALLERFAIQTAPSPTGLSIWDERAGLCFGQSQWASVFGSRLPASARAQFADLMALMFRHHRNPTASTIANVSLSEFLAARGYDDAIARYVLWPSISALWGFQPEQVMAMSAISVIESLNRFFVTAADEPFERVIPSTDAWLGALRSALTATLLTECRVTQVQASDTEVQVTSTRGTEPFDAVVIATHADTALSLLAAPLPAQATTLAAFSYYQSTSIVHTDPHVLPPTGRSDYNYRALATSAHTLATWDMRRIQGLQSDLFVTVGPLDWDDSQLIDPSRVIARVPYSHPAGTPAAVTHRPHLAALNAEGPVYFCGSYFGATGSNECALASAAAACERLVAAGHG
jgi:predicted NAD/FAD-binding protein